MADTDSPAASPSSVSASISARNGSSATGTLRKYAACAGSNLCWANRAVQTRISRLFFPFNDASLPPKLRKQAWAFRATYIVWTLGQTLLLFYAPHTALWHQDGELNAHSAWTLLLLLLISWVAYFQVQASNPGYITAHMLHRFNTAHDVFGVGDNGEGDTFTMSVFRTLTNLGRRAVTRVTASGEEKEAAAVEEAEETEGKEEEPAKEGVQAEDTDSSSSGEEDGPHSQSANSSQAQAATAHADDATGSGGNGSNSSTGEEDDIGDESAASQRMRAKARQSESMARVERFLAQQDKRLRGRGKKNKKKKRHVVQPGNKRRGQHYAVTGDDGDDEEPDLERGAVLSDDDDNEAAQAAAGGGAQKPQYASSRFVAENDEFGLEGVDDGSFQTRMDFEDIKDDFPLRSRYCKQADRVVPKFDHYCDLLGTPIGERNHALFWIFLVAQSLVLVHALSLTASAFTGSIIWNGPSNWAGRNALLIINMVLLGIPTISVVGLLGFHTWGAITDTLTYEFLKNNDLDYLKHFGPCDLPFSKGQCRNFYRFFVVQPGWCTSTKDWLPTKYAPPEQFYRDSANVCMNPYENKYWRCC